MWYQPPAFTVLAFWAFVIGGLVFGGVFLVNWQALARRPEVAAAATNVQPVSLGSGLPSLSVPLPRPADANSGEGKSGGARPPAAAPSSPLINLLPTWRGTERINILLLGIDRRPDEPPDRTRTDTIMVLSLDPVAKSAAMVSLPRDLWVQIPGYGPQRINVAHAVGGPELAKQTVVSVFGIPVSYYARVDFQGFENLVDTLGGVIVDVERPVKDDLYPTENYGYQRIYIAPGPQLLDGTTALQYARSRHSENDFGRSRRQQRLLVAMRDRALDLNMLPRAPQLMGIVREALGTDLSTTDMLALARLGSEIDRERIVTVVIDAEYATPFKGEGGADLLMPDTAAIRGAVDHALKAAARPELRARLEILNGTGRTGLGSVVGNHLAAQGYDVVRIAAADRTDYSTTTIQVVPGERAAGEALARALRLPAAAIREAPAPSAQADVRIVIGADFEAGALSR